MSFPSERARAKMTMIKEGIPETRMEGKRCRGNSLKYVQRTVTVSKPCFTSMPDKIAGQIDGRVNHWMRWTDSLGGSRQGIAYSRWK